MTMSYLLVERIRFYLAKYELTTQTQAHKASNKALFSCISTHWKELKIGDIFHAMTPDNDSILYSVSKATEKSIMAIPCHVKEYAYYDDRGNHATYHEFLSTAKKGKARRFQKVMKNYEFETLVYHQNSHIVCHVKSSDLDR